jgi:hypothetical protein
MKEFKGTPAPWSLYEDDRNYGRAIRDTQKNLICVPADMKPLSSSECYSNAKLIAAAPELLEALQLLLNDLQERGVNMQGDAIKIANEAIKKVIS